MTPFLRVEHDVIDTVHCSEIIRRRRIAVCVIILKFIREVLSGEINVAARRRANHAKHGIESIEADRVSSRRFGIHAVLLTRTSF